MKITQLVYSSVLFLVVPILRVVTRTVWNELPNSCAKRASVCVCGGVPGLPVNPPLWAFFENEPTSLKLWAFSHHAHFESGCASGAITTPVAHTMSKTSCPIAVPKGVAGEVGGRRRGSWGACDPLCKPFLSHKERHGRKVDMTILWVPSVWHSITPPQPLKNPGYALGACRNVWKKKRQVRSLPDWSLNLTYMGAL